MAQATTKGNAVTYGINGLGERISKSGMGVSPSPPASTPCMYDASGHLLGEYDDKGNVIEENVWLWDLPVATLPKGRIDKVGFISPDRAAHSIGTIRQPDRPRGASARKNTAS
jgi:hypothetical protein